MKIHIPKEMVDCEPELRYFFDNMVRKLHINRHKGFAKDLSIAEAFEHLASEVIELERDMRGKGSQFSVVMEAVDVANQAALLSFVVMRKTKPQYDEEIIK